MSFSNKAVWILAIHKYDQTPEQPCDEEQDRMWYQDEPVVELYKKITGIVDANEARQYITRPGDVLVCESIEQAQQAYYRIAPLLRTNFWMSRRRCTDHICEHKTPHCAIFKQ